MIPAAVARALAGYLLLFGAQRFGELAWSHRNARWLLARGAREHAAGHFAWFVVLHSAYPVALVAEVVRGARPGPGWPAWAAVWLGAQLLRASAMRALGPRWNVRILALPGEPPVRTGPYRWLAHPNYVAVALELVAGPLAFGAWRTAAAASLANALLMSVRIPAEERALREAAAARR